ncbi:MAG TPA: PstS family phosphate ABC transporter substrate-binding protein [Anaerolineae bacterium]|nr:PstS family phosphate ABC transporter substrate-binding protein [Anaerolineae bacterium]
MTWNKFRPIYLLISLLLIISVVTACGGTPPTEAPPAEEAPAEEAAATEAPAEEAAPAEEVMTEEEAPAEEEAMAEEEAPAEGEMAMAGELPAVDPLSVTGDIITAGSSTVFPLSERMAERFQDEGYAGNITIDSIGSGAGFERFCVAGETDISNASRAIKDTEIESCQAIGREPIEFRVGTDALAVVVSQENDFIEGATTEELAAIFSTAETWADVNPDWPAEPIQRFIPGTDSGTFDYFVEAVFEEDEEPILSASNLQLSEDDNVLVQGVEGSPYAIGFFGYAYYNENQEALKALAVDGVSPTEDSAEDGSYPLARPLFIYSDANIIAEKPQVGSFINFYLTNVDDEILDVGYFPASDAALGEAKAKLGAALGVEMAMGESSSAAPAEGEMAMAGELPAVDPLSVTGDIITAGSSTVFPLSERMAERFQDEGYAGNITIDSIGSGAGFERFCVAGETDISNASRAIKDTEIESCQAIGREPIEFRVGTDALAVVVSQENDFIEGATTEELAAIFSTAETWADVNPDWPAEPIQRFIPGTDSGTFDYFVEAVFEEDEEPILSASNLQLSEDDNVLVQGVEGSPYAIGFFGYAYYNENQEALKALAVDGVSPTEDSAEDGSYPLARPLFIYSDANIIAEKPQVGSFINFYLTNVDDEILDVGYFPASDAALGEAKAKLAGALGGLP